MTYFDIPTCRPSVNGVRVYSYNLENLKLIIKNKISTGMYRVLFPDD